MRKSYRDFIRVLLAACLAWTQTVLAAPLGETVPGVTAPQGGGAVVHEGVNEPGTGRARVWSFIRMNGNTPEFRYGTLNANNTVTWDAATSTRVPGGDLPKTDSIARSRALVPIGGASEINAPGREYLPEFADKNKWRRLRAEYRNVLDYRVEQAQELQRAARGVVHDAANSDAINRLARLSSTAADKAKAGGSKLGKVGVAFYVAIGFVAAYHLMADHSHNPMAWDSYIQSLPWNDPVGAIALVGFIAGSAYFYKKMGNLGPNGGIVRSVPYFAAALMAGSFVSTSVMVMWGNEHVKKCVKSGLKDKDACDTAGAWFMSSPEESGAVYEIANGFVPLAANILVAGGIYLGAIQSAAFIANKYKIAEAIRALSPTRTARSGGLAGLGFMVMHMALFLGAYQFSNSVFAVEKTVREHLVAEMGLFGHHYGRSIKETQEHLLKEWATLKKNNWKDPGSWDKLCYDPNRRFNLLYNCDRPDQLDLDGLLDRYGKLQGSWRAIQMQDTMSAYQQWMKKQNDFNEMVDTSYRFYKSALPLLASGTFNSANLKEAAPTANPAIANLNLDGTWLKVHTPKLQTFLLTSMACGPEAEGYGARGMWETTRRYLKDYVSGNTSPQNLIENPAGSAATFFPPRITNPLPGTTDTICEKVGGPIPSLFAQRYDVTTAPLYLTSYLTPDYHGLPAYIKDNIRTNVRGQELGDNFDQWWSANVTTNVIALQNDFLKEYRSILDTTYKTAVTRKDYKWCDRAGVPGAGLEKYMRRLMKPSDKCGPEAIHRLGYGIFDNLRDEMRFYMTLTLDTYLSNWTRIGGPIRDDDGVEVNPTSVEQVEKILIPRAAKVIDHFDNLTAQLALPDPKQRQDYDLIAREAVFAFNNFSNIVTNTPQTAYTPERVVEFHGNLIVQAPRPPYQVLLIQKLLKKTQQVFADSENYYNILTALDRPPERQ